NVLYTFTFSEPVTGFVAADVTVSGGTKGTFTAVSSTVYTLDVTPTANTQAGTITVDVAAGAANDAAANGNTVAIQATQAYDTKAPTVTITDDEPAVTANIAGGNVLYTFTFSEPVTGFVAADVTVSGGTKGTFTAVSSTVYTLDVTPTANTQAGTITVDVAAGAANDAAANGNIVAIQATQAYDTKAPTVPAITSIAENAGGGINATEASDGTPVVVNLTGTGAVANDTLTINWGGQTVTHTLTAGEVSGNSATVTVPAGTITTQGDGTFNVTAKLTDVAGNSSPNSSATSVKVDTAAPTVAITDDEPGTANSAGGNVIYTFQFSETVTGFTASDVAVVNGTKGTFTAVDGDTYTLVVTPTTNFEGNLTVDVAAAAATDAVGNNSTAAIQSVQVVDTKAPTVSVSNPGNVPQNSSATITFTFSEAVTNFSASDVTASGGTLTNFAQVNATTWTETFTRTTSSNNASVTVANTYTDIAGNAGTTGASGNIPKPAGVAGAPINLALADPTGYQGEVTLKVTGAPSDWTLNGATHNSDGSWTVVTNEVGSLTVTTPVTYTGAVLLNVAETWINAVGSIGYATVVDNVEAYAPGSPIFALSGDDTLTGSSRHDMFVFSQPIGHDVIYSFDATSDQIDLIGYANFTGFGDIQAHMANDAAGNAVITLAEGQSITLNGVDAASLTASDFVFDQTPVTENAGQMMISDGAVLPLSGIIDNTGTIELHSTGSGTDLELIEHGITLQGQGQVVLSDSDQNVITGTVSDVTLTNVDNTISGAGHLGDGMMILVNEGTIIANVTNTLEIDTGTNTIVNAGMLESTGSGGLVIESAVSNSGLLWANGGTVTAQAEVTGSGTAEISGTGTMEFGAASSANIIFDANATGHLILDDAFHFTGAVSGLAASNDIDLKGIAFGADTTLSFTENQAGTGGTLTVSDGAHTANVVLLGQYDPTGFNDKADATNGTAISYDQHHMA
ncbi:Ig-like domain-containing protein, partial [Bradyrhizobium sp. SSUT112]|uniref:beta strand repeat-containing protein n=1 Tax=Bradyrhizobium sp. SSUT112 TaxID=3040604 RepID=UPI00244BE4A6